jgi:hypothetical protein
MRGFKRLLILAVPWVLFFVGIAVTFGPQEGAQWLLAAHWLLIPFLPVYAVVVALGFRATRAAEETSTQRWLKSARRQRK